MIVINSKGQHKIYQVWLIRKNRNKLSWLILKIAWFEIHVQLIDDEDLAGTE